MKLCKDCKHCVAGIYCYREERKLTNIVTGVEYSAGVKYCSEERFLWRIFAPIFMRCGAGGRYWVAK